MERDTELPDPRAGGMRVHGFITTVLPTFTNPPADPARWGWWRFDSHDWIPCTAPNITFTPSTTITFDEDGTRA